jgi:hypothetical protein
MRSKNDRQKLLNDGFTILRTDERCLIMKSLQHDGRSWKIWKPFNSKAQMEREIKRIDALEPKIIIE